MRQRLQTILAGFLLFTFATLRLDAGEKPDYPRPKEQIAVTARCTARNGKTYELVNAKLASANGVSSVLEGRDGPANVRIALADILKMTFASTATSNQGFRPAEISRRRGRQEFVEEGTYEIRTYDSAGKPISIVGRSGYFEKTIPLTQCTAITFTRLD